MKVAGVSLYLPEHRENKEDFLKKGVSEKDVEYFGVYEKRVTEKGQRGPDMEVEAASMALKSAGLSASDIDLIISVPLYPEIIGAPNASLLQHRIGAQNAAAFDMVHACNSIISSLIVSANFIALGQYKRILLTASTNWSVTEDPAHPEYCYVLSDGAGAVVLTDADSDYGILSFDMKTDGKFYYKCGTRVGQSGEAMYYEHHNSKLLFYIDETDIFGSTFGQRILTLGPSCFKAALKKANLTPDDIDCAIIQGVVKPVADTWIKMMKVPADRVPLTYSKYGHLSVVILIANLLEGLNKGMIKKGDGVAFVSVGAGISAGSVIMRWS